MIRIQETNSNEGVKQNKSPNSSRIQFLEADLDQEPSSFTFHDQRILQQDLTLKSLPLLCDEAALLDLLLFSSDCSERRRAFSELK